MISAAGVLFLTPDDRVLLLRRTDVGDHAGTWSTPGGKIEDGETPEQAARRECQEEIGREPGEIAELCRRQRDGVDFVTFLARVEEPFAPKLNDEHDQYDWTPISDLSPRALPTDQDEMEQALADADDKRPKTDVDYTDHATVSAEQCQYCAHFDGAHDACERVVGTIDPHGWCKLWKSKSE